MTTGEDPLPLLLDRAAQGVASFSLFLVLNLKTFFLRLGEGISRLSRAAHQCVLCSLFHFRASGHQIPNI